MATMEKNRISQTGSKKIKRVTWSSGVVPERMTYHKNKIPTVINPIATATIPLITRMERL